jgi:hypothetical protein
MGEVLEVIQGSLTSAPQTSTGPSSAVAGDEDVVYAPEDDGERWDNDEEQVFDDVGEGAGIEGDLDMEDD